ncbi:MAG: molecular chaperone DnaJ [Acidobacteriota bacterium]
MDYYVILGLEPGASPAEIKRAYRRLARRYHPGINPGDRAAEAMFARIAEAYETLNDPDRRRQYDAAGGRSAPTGRPGAFEFAGFDFSFAAQGSEAATFSELFAEVLHPPEAEKGQPERGADLHAALTVSFEESIRGSERQIIVTRQVECQVCNGSGRIRMREGRCPHCQATGKVRWARGHMVFAKACGPCGGTGRQREVGCEVCGGRGRVVRSEAVPVTVPPGVADGARLRVPEKGHAGHRRGRTGDLYVDVAVQPHALIRREGDDLVILVPVAVHEAMLGARISVPTLDGNVSLKVPPGTQAGQRFRISGRGAPARSGGRGDLIVEVKVVLPAFVDERSKELMREFGRLNTEDVRRDLQV